MKVLVGVATAPFEAHLAEVEVQEPGSEDIVIRTEYSFISGGTEGHVHRQEFPEPPYVFPIALGYQCVGRLEWIGSKVTSLALGQRVFTRRNRVVGMASMGGVHARQVVTAAANVVPIPDGVDPREAAGLVVAQVGYNAATRLPDIPGQSVVVIGDGIIGQCAAQAALARGCCVVLSGHHDTRLRLAKTAAPALETVNVQHENLNERMGAIAGGQADAVVDCVGSPQTMMQALDIVKPLGHVVLVGYWASPQTIDAHAAFLKELTIHFPAGARPERMLATLEWLRVGRLRLLPLITHHVAARDFAEACRLLGGRSGDYLGILVDWTGV